MITGTAIKHYRLAEVGPEAPRRSNSQAAERRRPLAALHEALRSLLVPEELPDPRLQPLKKPLLPCDARSGARHRVTDPFARWPKGLHFVIQGHCIRVVRDQVFARPANETFHEFLVFHMAYTLDDEWHRKQRTAPQAQQHVVTR